MFQSTHSRGVRRFRAVLYCPLFPVSIHALTRSATSPVIGVPSACLCFNPRTHEECDYALEYMEANAIVSIHALTRSATAVRPYQDKLIMCVSIHALTRSATVCDVIYSLRILFQSTHSRGVRPIIKSVGKAPRMFQSTHSRGVRPGKATPPLPCMGVSIHALTRSATAYIFSFLFSDI